MKILIADDSEDIRLLLQTYCKGMAYCLTFAEDGERAFAAYNEGFYDLIVLDVQMPMMDGLTATRKIREVEYGMGRKRTPILVLTGNADQQDLTETFEASYDGYLNKPIYKQVFLAALEQWLPSGQQSGSLKVKKHL